MKPQNQRNPYQNYYYRSSSSRGRPSSHAPKPPRRKHRLRKVLLGIVILAVLVAAGWSVAAKRTANPSSPAKPSSAQTSKKQAKASGLSTQQLVTMSNAINAVIGNNSDIDMSVSLIDLNGGQTEHYGDTQAFTAASTTKVITAADFLQEVQNGQQSLSETINGNTAKYEIQQMIVVSDDNAWDALNDTLGYSQLQSYANSIGLASFQSEPNTVTSNDMALILEKLYDGQLLNATNTQLLLSYLKQANYREYIVPAVPSSDTIYHKIGLYEDNVNDEAIITDGQKAFVIAIFTNGNGVYNWPARAVMMQQITQAALAAYF